MNSLYEKLSPKKSVCCSQKAGTSTSPIVDVMEEEVCTQKVTPASPTKPAQTLATEFKLVSRDVLSLYKCFSANDELQCNAGKDCVFPIIGG